MAEEEGQSPPASLTTLTFGLYSMMYFSENFFFLQLSPPLLKKPRGGTISSNVTSPGQSHN
jgi:hypothetical protein